MTILAGKQAIVTGAAGRIGQAVTKELLQQGARILAIDADGETLREMETDSVTAYEADLLDEQSYVQLQKMVENLPKLDIVVNCMGGIYRSPFLAHDPEQFKRLWMLNVYTVMRICQITCTKMVTQEEGKIINFAAVGAIRPNQNHSGYCAAKASLVAFSRTLALEMAPYGIQVNVIAPGPTETIPPTSTYYADHPEIYHGVINSTPQARLGTPEDHMGLVTFFASHRSNWTTGQVVMSDGGLELS
mgnify:CR=1 FL=1